jgi:hypothetical protein
MTAAWIEGYLPARGTRRTPASAAECSAGLVSANRDGWISSAEARRDIISSDERKL